MAEVSRPRVHQPGEADAAPRIAWTAVSADLHVNVVALGPGEAIGGHVNAALDVLLTCIAGTGTLTVDGEEIPLAAGTVALIPRGAHRGSRAGMDGLRYVTCHRRRPALMPTVAPRQG